MKILIFPLIIFIFLFTSASEVFAQKRFSKTYPASRNVRLQLVNCEGTVSVSGWDRNEVRLSAAMEAPAAKVVPSVSNDSLIINIVRDNPCGGNNVGSVYFDVKVPFSSTVDIETKRGNLTVRDINGSMVRARISLGGDITLTGIRSSTAIAENITGDIFFDGELQSGGRYSFSSTNGNINIRIPFTSSFKLMATAPSTRQIELGSFSNAGLNFVSNGRQLVGSVGDGRANLTIVNKRGGIAFIRR